MPAIPLLPGAVECIRGGVSSLHEANARALEAVDGAERLQQLDAWPLLVDPQTGGRLQQLDAWPLLVGGGHCTWG